jgi:hypothetical protein
LAPVVTVDKTATIEEVLVIDKIEAVKTEGIVATSVAT